MDGMDHLFGELGPKLVGLGARHYGFGAEEAQYAVSYYWIVLLFILKDFFGIFSWIFSWIFFWGFFLGDFF